jgi:hypothetical protein
MNGQVAMSCKEFAPAIRDAALYGEHSQDAATGSGRLLRRALLAHLQECAPCRARYAEEQGKFASMDEGLSRIANTAPSSSFLPRVRAAIDHEQGLVAGATRRWISLRPARVAMAMAAGCVIAAALLAFHSRLPRDLERRTSDPLAIPGASSGQISEASPTLSTPAKIGAARRQVRLALRNAEPLGEPEILVSAAERAAFGNLVARPRQRQDLAVALESGHAVSTSAETSSKSLEIAELKVASLTPAEHE